MRSQWQRTRAREQEALDRIKQMKVEHTCEIQALQEQINTLKGQLADMKHLVFGRSTEKHPSTSRGRKIKGRSRHETEVSNAVIKVMAAPQLPLCL